MPVFNVQDKMFAWWNKSPSTDFYLDNLITCDNPGWGTIGLFDGGNDLFSFLNAE